MAHVKKSLFSCLIVFTTVLLQQFSLSAKESSRYDNLSLGLPSQADTIIDRLGYALGYIECHEQVACVIYKLTAKEATIKNAQRSNKFCSDPEIPTGSATTGDYHRSGYDRGHLASAADMAFPGQTMADTSMVKIVSLGSNSFLQVSQFIFWVHRRFVTETGRKTEKTERRN